MDAIPVLDRRGLREFGLVTGGIVAVLFGLVFPWLLDVGFPVWPWIVLAVLGGWGLLLPDSLGPVYRVWMRFALLLSKITTPIIMGAVFYIVVTPAALVLRVIRWDPMRRHFDANATTYRTVSDKSRKGNLESPF